VEASSACGGRMTPVAVSQRLFGLRKRCADFVILSEAKNLSSIYVQAKKEGEILRFAQNDTVLFSGTTGSIGVYFDDAIVTTDVILRIMPSDLLST
jgi:hypothetical protein